MIPEFFHLSFTYKIIMFGGVLQLDGLLFHYHLCCLLAAVGQGLYHDVDALLKTVLLHAAYSEDSGLYGCTVFCGSVGP